MHSVLIGVTEAYDLLLKCIYPDGVQRAEEGDRGGSGGGGKYVQARQSDNRPDSKRHEDQHQHRRR